MAASPPVTALPWYDRRDYPALLKLFSDPDKLPATYDAWLERAEGVERQFKRAGFGVARIWIRPVPFAAWCRERNISPDQRARLTFANEAARSLSARRLELLQGVARKVEQDLARHRQLIEDLRRDGHRTTEAEDVLQRFETAYQALLAKLNALTGEEEPAD